MIKVRPPVLQLVQTIANQEIDTPWCNGNTKDFGSFIHGSNPCGVVLPTKTPDFSGVFAFRTPLFSPVLACSTSLFVDESPLVSALVEIDPFSLTSLLVPTLNSPIFAAKHSASLQPLDCCQSMHKLSPIRIGPSGPFVDLHAG